MLGWAGAEGGGGGLAANGAIMCAGQSGSPCAVPAGPGRQKNNSKEPRAFPSDMIFNKERRDWANQKGCTDAARQFEMFKAHHSAKGSRFSNWEAAWQKWILKAVELKETRHG